MTRFQLFINELTNLPLRYIQAIGCEVSEADFDRLQSPHTSSTEVATQFDSYLKSFDSKGSMRKSLIKYLTEHLCLWRDFRQNATAYEEAKPTLEAEIQCFLSTLLALESTPNSKFISPGEYQLQGLKPTWPSSGRGQAVAQQFFQALAVIWSKPVTAEIIGQEVSHMLNEHSEFFVYLNQQKELDRAKEIISELDSKIDNLQRQLQRNSQTHSIEAVPTGSNTTGLFNNITRSSLLGMFSAMTLEETEVDDFYRYS